MSRTYEIVCHDCKKTLWIAQSPLSEPERTAKAYIYKTEKDLKNLEGFLFSHQRHKLEFGDDEYLETIDYESLDRD